MRQTYSFSCGVACLIAVRDLVNYGELRSHSTIDENQIIDNIDISTTDGLTNDAMVNYIKSDELLSVFFKSYGENTYHDGLAIANVRNFRSGVGHYVVLLGRSKLKSSIRFYDPIDGAVHEMDTCHFEWLNGRGDIKNWSVNFSVEDSFFDIKSTEKKTFILKGENDEFNPIYDTVSFLYNHFTSANKAVTLADDSKISIIDGALYFDGLAVREGDDVWLKIDPRQDEQYFLTLRILSLFEDRINFYNPPSKVMLWDDKMLSLSLNEYYLVNSSINIKQMSYFFRNTNYVLKRLNGFGGRDVHFSDAGIDHEKLDGPYLAELDISTDSGNNEDVRVFWFKGKYVGAVKRFSRGSKLCNMTQGGGHKSFLIEDLYANLPLKIIEQLEYVSDVLLTNDFKIAGVDILNGQKITEINVSNVSVFKNFIEDTGINFIN